MEKTIGIIGFGNMGSAIANRIKSKYKVIIFDKDKSKTKCLASIKVADTIFKLVKNTDVIILAVKPQDFNIILAKIKNYAKDKLIISIAAGITTDYIEKKLTKASVVRVMPNLPAQIGEGMICLCKGKYAKKADLVFTQQLLKSLGTTLNIRKGLMNAVTAISGSGPGYLYRLLQDKKKEEWEKFCSDDFFPKLSLAAQRIGFSIKEARVLAKTTINGSISLLKTTGLTPETLCLKVASKGGTTEAGLNVLNKDLNLEEAVKAALERAKKLER